MEEEQYFDKEAEGKVLCALGFEGDFVVLGMGGGGGGGWG